MKSRTGILILSVGGFALSGMLAVTLIFGFAAVMAHRDFSFGAFRELSRDYSILYLCRLIPVFAGLGGYYAGKVFWKKKTAMEKDIAEQRTRLESVAEFARQIGNGNLENAFHGGEGAEELTLALEGMRKSLLTLQRVENERNEISEIKTEVNNILRAIDETGKLADEIISYLVNRLEPVVQGAFYLAGEKENTEGSLDLVSSYAWDRKKHLKASFKFAEGLVGQAAVEKDLIHRTEIPDDFVTITSGLMGHKKPRSILLVPLIFNDRVYGVIELAAIRPFTETHLHLFSELGEVIARSVFNVRVNEETRTLLAQSEKMSRELVEQKQQLVQNADDMIRTQKELRETNSRLGEKIREVDKSNKKTQILLENASEVIFIYSEGGQTLYVSPSVRSILGYYPDEIIGGRSTDHIHPQDTERFASFQKDIISFPEKKHSLQYRCFTRHSEIIWLEAMGKNFIDDPVINGIVINSRDISGQRLAASEQRIRAKMQALSENSIDLILRIDIFSRCTYINPVIEAYTGLSRENFLNRPITEVQMESSVISEWKRILEKVSKRREKEISEMIFPTAEGEKIMQVSAIPEFYENGEVESVLLVCHDISKAKLREELIKKKNKSINDSINYAYYIQSSLMPSEERLQGILPNSFMFYKPKDVVSGDYPFIYQDGQTIYIGAMDCTGHGVPGALMSIIGYFLQNQIIHNYPDDDAGEVLNKLHANVIETLRQYDEDSRINDGMDAALCKIDMRHKVLNFAGAHRPLYRVSDGEFSEIRGDRFPVGGTQYNNRKSFTNHRITIQPGDAFYFMTDGFADQYGGPTGKQKFMSGNVNRLIRENTHLSIFQMGNLFRQTYDAWKGQVEQLDDVLVIGLKF